MPGLMRPVPVVMPGIGPQHGPQVALVVLCAGVYGTPEILLRSGIGPAAELAELGLRFTRTCPPSGQTSMISLRRASDSQGPNGSGRNSNSPQERSGFRRSRPLPRSPHRWQMARSTCMCTPGWSRTKLSRPDGDAWSRWGCSRRGRTAGRCGSRPAPMTVCSIDGSGPPTPTTGIWPGPAAWDPTPRRAPWSTPEGGCMACEAFASLTPRYSRGSRAPPRRCPRQSPENGLPT